MPTFTREQNYAWVDTAGADVGSVIVGMSTAAGAGASVVVSGSSAFAVSGSVGAVAVPGSGVVPIAVSILGASSETLLSLPLSEDFERPRDLN